MTGKRVFFPKVIPSRQPPIVGLPWNKAVYRHQDLLVLTFSFFNLELKKDNVPPYLYRKDANKDAFIAVHFQGQNIRESAFDDSDILPHFYPVPNLISGPTRLAFKIPKDINKIDFTLESLLDWDRFHISLSENALPLNYRPFQTPPNVRKPKYYGTPETAIEFPYHLIISPDVYAKWLHIKKSEPSLINNRIDLWHTRLVSRNANDPNGYVRAIWCREWNANAGAWPDKELVDLPGVSLSKPNPQQRCEIVRLSSDFTQSEKNTNVPYKPVPIVAKMLMLSSLGAWADITGKWKENALADVDLINWEHKSTQGRDNYVKTVELGYLFPTGNKAVRVKITERKFSRASPMSLQPLPDLLIPRSDHGPSLKKVSERPAVNQNQFENPPLRAYLFVREYIVVIQPTITYTRGKAKHNKGRNWPFKEITITSTVTPDLDKIDELYPEDNVEMFWPKVNNQPFQFHIVATDLEGKQTEFGGPLVFVSSKVTGEYQPDTLDTVLNKIFKEQNGNENFDKLKIKIMGEKIHYAESQSKGDTSFQTQEFIWKWDIPLTFSKDDPPFYPIIDRSTVYIESINQLFGKKEAVEVRYYDPYLKDIGDNNFKDVTKGQVFLELKDSQALKFSGTSGGGDKVGGLASPNFNIQGISRTKGPVSDIEEMNIGHFNPLVWFEGFDGNFLGGIKLTDILNVSPLELVNSPGFTSKIIGNMMETEFNWETDKIQEFDSDIFKFSIPAGKCTLGLNSKLTAEVKPDGIINPNNVFYTAKGTIKNFALSFFDTLIIAFKSFSFTSQNGKKADIDVKLADDPIEFKGCLSFVNELKHYISTEGFSDPPNLTVSPTGIIAGYSQAIPSIGIGIFSIENIKFGAELKLPFTGDPVTAKFMFSEKNDPFHISVMMFSGGGYFGIALNTTGIEYLEAALEFGGNLSIDLGVASGGVYIYAGIYMLKGDSDFVLTGYLRCGGALEILGLICVSLEFYMSLEYVESGNKVSGQATLTIEIDVFLFSKTIELTVRREFAHSPHFDFQDAMDLTEWEEYCNCFAPEVV